MRQSTCPNVKSLTLLYPQQKIYDKGNQTNE